MIGIIMKKQWSILDYKIALNDLRKRHKGALADLREVQKVRREYEQQYNFNQKQIRLIDNPSDEPITITLCDAINGITNNFTVLKKKKLDYFEDNQKEYIKQIGIYKKEEKELDEIMFKYWNRYMELNTEYHSILLNVEKSNKKNKSERKSYLIKEEKRIYEHEKLIMAWIKLFNSETRISNNIIYQNTLAKNCGMSTSTLTRRLQDDKWCKELHDMVISIQRGKYSFETIRNKDFNQEEVYNLGNLLAMIESKMLKEVSNSGIPNYNNRTVPLDETLSKHNISRNKKENADDEYEGYDNSED